MAERSEARLSVAKLIGQGYGRGWYTNCHARYRLFKGARNTKKSYVMIGLEVLCKILTNPLRNIVILRRMNTTNRTSTFATLCMLIDHPDPENPMVSLRDYFRINNNTMTITYIPTGQVIMFFGMSDPEKITSTRMVHGYMTDIYVEEAFEIKDYEDWRKVDGSLRGRLPEGLFLQVTFCFNAWNKKHWLYEHFYKGRLEDDFNYLDTHKYADWYDPNLVIDYGKGLYLHISTYKINEFRDTEIYDEAMQHLRQASLEIYKVEALGMWGASQSATYPEYNDTLKPEPQVFFSQDYACYSIGIDFGISDGQGRMSRNSDSYGSATTMQLVGVTADYNKLDCIDEYFWSNENKAVKKTGPEIQKELVDTLWEWIDKYKAHQTLMKGTLRVYVDCAHSGGFRQALELEARKQGLFNVRFIASTKLMIESRVYFVRQLMAYGDFRVNKKFCDNLDRELCNAQADDKGHVRGDTDDHAINANEYAWAPLAPRIRLWKTFKAKA